MMDSLLFRSTSLRSLPLIVTALLLGVLVGCDTVELRTEDEIQSEGADEVEIRSDSFTRADIRFEPVSVAQGETFSIRLMDEELGGEVTRITHEGTSGDRHLLRAQFDPLNPASVKVRCRNEENGTKRTMATLGGAALKSGSSSGEMVARGDQEPTSYHYIQDGENTIVEVDYDQNTETNAVDLGGAFTFPSSDADTPVQCTHVSFVMEEVSRTLTADGIQFEGSRPAFREKRVE